VLRATGGRLGAIVLAGLLCAAATGWAQDDEADTEAPADEAVSKCVTKCETEHDTCTAAAKAQASDCERQKATCDQGCSLCTRMYGPQVVYCVQDCESCRAKLAASACGKPPKGDAECAPALEKCLERCGP
jgi:hypothetical protein